MTGTLVVATPNGTWVMPPQRGMWIPPATTHDVRAMGAVRLQSLFVEPSAATDLPGCCQVVGISTFMRILISEALELPLLYDMAGRDGALMTLIQYEMLHLPVLPLSLPFPRRSDFDWFRRRCRDAASISSLEGFQTVSEVLRSAKLGHRRADGFALHPCHSKQKCQCSKAAVRPGSNFKK
jgi:hypothetical protein